MKATATLVLNYLRPSGRTTAESPTEPSSAFSLGEKRELHEQTASVTEKGAQGGKDYEDDCGGLSLKAFIRAFFFVIAKCNSLIVSQTEQNTPTLKS